MTAPRIAGPAAVSGRGIRRGGGIRRTIVLAAALLLVLVTLFPAAPETMAGSPSRDTRSFEERATAERTSRSRFRRLEVASLVLILVCGGAVTLWAIRRK